MAAWIPASDPDGDGFHFLAKPCPLVPDLYVMGSREPYATDWYDPDGNQLWWVPEPMGFHNPRS